MHQCDNNPPRIDSMESMPIIDLRGIYIRAPQLMVTHSLWVNLDYKLETTSTISWSLCKVIKIFSLLFTCRNRACYASRGRWLENYGKFAYESIKGFDGDKMN